MKHAKSVRILAGVAVLGLASAATTTWAQVSASPPSNGKALEDSMQALAGQVRELNATVQALREEVSRSRQETGALRAELRGAIEKLSTSSAVNGAATKSAPSTSGAPVAIPQAPAGAQAQEATVTSARLNRLEEDQQLLQAKIDEQHQTKVESASKYRVKLSGIALLNVFGNRGVVDSEDIPNLALPHGALATSGSFGATARQSEIGLEVYGPTLGGARASTQVNFDFLGGFANVSNGATDNLVRLRTATMRLDWKSSSIVGGQDAPFFSPLSPTSFASLGYPEFADAGNLWTWTPQLRVEHRIGLSEASGLLLQAGVLDPLSGEAPASQYYRAPTGGEQSRKPAVASHVAWSHGSADHALTLGVGGYYSRQNYGAGRTMDAWAGTADWSIPLPGRLGLSGEFYRGRALGGLGAAQGRSVLFRGPESNPASELTGLNTIGGWTQLKFRATEAIEFNAAFGEDNPFAHDLHYFYAPTSFGYTSIAKDQNAMFNMIYRPRSDLLFALEYRFLDTLQTTNVANTAGTLNLSIGLLF